MIKTDENRIELESHILCAALRHSWAESDVEGVIRACQQLNQIFPDLLQPKELVGDTEPANQYDLLQIDYHVNQPKVKAAYIKAVKRFLRANKKIRRKRKEFYNILNAGLILRSPRLRLSHDLTVASNWLVNNKDVREFSSLEITETPSREPLPFIVTILETAQFIEQSEVQALSNQMSRYPEIPIFNLVLRAGYVTEPQLRSLQEAEQLLLNGKITMNQFLNSPKLREMKKSR